MAAAQMIKVVVTHGVVMGNAEDGTVRDHGVGETMLMNESSAEALKDRVRRVEAPLAFAPPAPTPQKAPEKK